MKNKIDYLEQKVRNLSFLNEFGKSLGATLDLNKISDIVATQLKNIICYDVFSMLFINKDKDLYKGLGLNNNRCILKIQSDFDVKDNFSSKLKNEIVDTFSQMTGEELSSGEVVTDIRNYRKKQGKRKTISDEMTNYSTDIKIPLAHSGNKKIGLINIINFKKKNYPDQKLDLILDVADKTSVALKNAIEHKKVMELAKKDCLTKIWNRRTFEDVLENEYNLAVKTKKPLSLIMIDVDDFKKINDTKGHQFGDRVLQRVSQMLFENIRETDVLARYGGDEFVIILRNTDIKKASRLINRISKNVNNNKTDFEKIQLNPGISMGAADLSSLDVKCKNELISLADRALYQMKKKRKLKNMAA